MPGVKSARIRANKMKEMCRIIKMHPEITTSTLAKMFSVSVSVISLWKKKSGLIKPKEA